jgi:hypothetical protein
VALALLQCVGIVKLYRENSRSRLERTPVPILIKDHVVILFILLGTLLVPYLVIFVISTLFLRNAAYLIVAVVAFQALVYPGY